MLINCQFDVTIMGDNVVVVLFTSIKIAYTKIFYEPFFRSLALELATLNYIITSTGYQRI